MFNVNYPHSLQITQVAHCAGDDSSSVCMYLCVCIICIYRLYIYCLFFYVCFKMKCCVFWALGFLERACGGHWRNEKQVWARRQPTPHMPGNIVESQGCVCESPEDLPWLGHGGWGGLLFGWNSAKCHLGSNTASCSLRWWPLSHARCCCIILKVGLIFHLHPNNLLICYCWPSVFLYWLFRLMILHTLLTVNIFQLSW